MTFTITGINAKTGARQSVRVEAATRQEAEAEAIRWGLRDLEPAAASGGAAPAALPGAGGGLSDQRVLLAVCAVLLVLALAGLFWMALERNRAQADAQDVRSELLALQSAQEKLRLQIGTAIHDRDESIARLRKQMAAAGIETDAAGPSATQPAPALPEGAQAPPRTATAPATAPGLTTFDPGSVTPIATSVDGPVPNGGRRTVDPHRKIRYYDSVQQLMQRLPIDVYPPTGAASWDQLHSGMATTWANENLVGDTITVKAKYVSGVVKADVTVFLVVDSFDATNLTVHETSVEAHFPRDQSESLMHMVNGKEYQVRGTITKAAFTSWTPKKKDDKTVYGFVRLYLGDCVVQK